MPRRFTIDCAHGRSADTVAGWQLKMLRRTGVSDTPVTAYGPFTVSSRRCGNSEKPYATAFDVLFSEYLSGLMRSCTTP